MNRLKSNMYIFLVKVEKYRTLTAIQGCLRASEAENLFSGSTDKRLSIRFCERFYSYKEDLASSHLTLSRLTESLNQTKNMHCLTVL